MGAAQVMVPVAGHTAVERRSPPPLAPKQIRPAFTAQRSERPPTPILPCVSWPSRQQPCSIPRSLCAQRSAGNGAGGALATGGGFGGSGGLGGSIGLHNATFLLMSASSAASSPDSFLPSAWASSSDAFR